MCFRLAHFDYVKAEDLEKIGMGKPAIRRLMDAVKRRKKRKSSSLLDRVRVLVLKLRTHLVHPCRNKAKNTP